jgi:Uma2 family endonuclease
MGEGGPGGWIILDEPEIRLGKHTVVPDIAGWKRERLTKLPETNWISVVPDWICEVLSPGTARIDRKKKMPLYAQFGLPYLWIADPLEKTLEIFRLDSGFWIVVSVYSEDDIVRAEPFQEIEINLNTLWE